VRGNLATRNQEEVRKRKKRNRVGIKFLYVWGRDAYWVLLDLVDNYTAWCSMVFDWKGKQNYPSFYLSSIILMQLSQALILISLMTVIGHGS